MANPNAVANRTADSFGRFLIAQAKGVSVGAQANVAATLPLLDGGLTNSSSAATSGAVIVRQVTFCNPSGNISNANVGILTSNDGNVSNAVVSVFKLTTLNAVARWQDGNIASTYTTNELTGNANQALFAFVSTAGATTGTVDIKVYGDVVSF